LRKAAEQKRSNYFQAIFHSRSFPIASTILGQSFSSKITRNSIWILHSGLKQIGKFHKSSRSSVNTFGGRLTCWIINFRKCSFDDLSLCDWWSSWITLILDFLLSILSRIWELRLMNKQKRWILSLPGLALAHHQLYVAVKAQGHGRQGIHALEHINGIRNE
jgi:hypothetical protein